MRHVGYCQELINTVAQSLFILTSNSDIFLLIYDISLDLRQSRRLDAAVIPSPSLCDLFAWFPLSSSVLSCQLSILLYAQVIGSAHAICDGHQPTDRRHVQRNVRTGTCVDLSMQLHSDCRTAFFRKVWNCSPDDTASHRRRVLVFCIPLGSFVYSKFYFGGLHTRRWVYQETCCLLGQTDSCIWNTLAFLFIVLMFWLLHRPLFKVAVIIIIIIIIIIVIFVYLVP